MLDHPKIASFSLIWLLASLSTFCLAQEPDVRLASGSEHVLYQASPPSTVVDHAPSCRYYSSTEQSAYEWLEDTKVGYDGGFVIASEQNRNLLNDDLPYKLKINGWGQLRHTMFDSDGTARDLNQIQLKRARLVFSGSAFTPNFNYFIQLDGRSVSGDNLRLLDYYLRYDFGHHRLGLEPGRLGFLSGRYKVPFNLARWLSGREFEFTDRSVASIFFDVNRSLASSVYGRVDVVDHPIEWEATVFNGLVTGGAETGSTGALDNNFAISGRAYSYFFDEWGDGQLADFDYHDRLAARMGCGFALSEIDRRGSTEFSALRVVDSGQTLESILPLEVESYRASLMSVDGSLKYRGFSLTLEYYFRIIDQFRGAPISELFDHGFWLQAGYFIIPEKLELMTRWSRVQGNSGTLGAFDLSDEEIAGGLAWYFRRNHAKLVTDMTFLDGAPINSSVLDISPGDIGFLIRSQLQFSF